MNTRLICASQFFRQFRFEVRYKSDKEYIMSDVLSRLASQKPYAIVFEDHFELDTFYVDYNYSSI